MLPVAGVGLAPVRRDRCPVLSAHRGGPADRRSHQGDANTWVETEDEFRGSRAHDAQGGPAGAGRGRDLPGMSGLYQTAYGAADFHADTREFFRGRVVAVTGGTGFIGSHLVEQ